MRFAGIWMCMVLLVANSQLASADVSDVFTSVQVNLVGGADSTLDAANEPSFAIDPTNLDRIAVGWRQFDSVGASLYYAGVAYSTDGGETWSERNYVDVVAGQSRVSRSDPVLDYAGDGTFYYYSLNRNSFPRTADMFISPDGGQSWTMDTDPSAHGGDKCWIAVDRTGGATQGNIYAHWRWELYGGEFFGCCGVEDRVTRSRDGGSTFDEPFPHFSEPDDWPCALNLV